MTRSLLKRAARRAVSNPSLDYLLGFGIRSGYEDINRLVGMLMDVADKHPNELKLAIATDEMGKLADFLVDADPGICSVELHKLAEENEAMHNLLFEIADRHSGRLRLPAYRLAAACSVLVRCGPALAGV